MHGLDPLLIIHLKIKSSVKILVVGILDLLRPTILVLLLYIEIFMCLVTFINFIFLFGVFDDFVCIYL